MLHGPQGAVALAAPDVVQMMSTFAGHVFVRSLGQQDRCLALSLLDRAMEVRAGVALIAAAAPFSFPSAEWACWGWRDAKAQRG